MIALILAGALLAQDYTQDEVIEEGERIGRAAAAMGMCKSFGYRVYEQTGAHWAQTFGEDAEASGWSASVVQSAIQAGTASELAEAALQDIPDAATDAEFVAQATAVVERVKARCRRLAQEHSGLISHLDEGDRNADAQLAIMVRPLSQ
jgi:hypothetical protein